MSDHSPGALVEETLQEVERSLQSLERVYLSAVRSLIVLRSQIRGELETDELTRLLRRGAFTARLNRLLLDGAARGSEIHVMMIDLDHFKGVNDRFGHPTGDAVLERVAHLVSSFLRPTDLAGRYGGEELVVAVECDAPTAHSIAERIRSRLSEQPFVPAGDALAAASAFKVTLSAGMASTADYGFDAPRLIAAADRALYAAKRAGRDRVERAQEAIA